MGRGCRLHWFRSVALIGPLLLCTQVPHAAAATLPFALWRIDPLGVDDEIVQRLEALFRMELGRVAEGELPSAAAVARVAARDARLGNCTGEIRCLTMAGRALGVARMISGNVGGLGDSYVLNLKLIDVSKKTELRRVQEVMRGDADQLIEAVRVAAYRLVAPERLRGSLQVLANINGARVFIDGHPVGNTPLARQEALAVGLRTVRVSKAGYVDVIQSVPVRLQKTARVIVNLQAPVTRSGRSAQQLRRPPWYAKWWAWALIGAAAVGTGVVLGLAVSGDAQIDCAAEPARCGL